MMIKITNRFNMQEKSKIKALGFQVFTIYSIYRSLLSYNAMYYLKMISAFQSNALSPSFGVSDKDGF